MENFLFDTISTLLKNHAQEITYKIFISKSAEIKISSRVIKK